MTGKISPLRISWGIIFTNIFFLVLSGVIIMVSMWNISEQNARELSHALIAEIQNSVSNRTVNYFSPAQTVNQSLAFLVSRYFDDPIEKKSGQDLLFKYYSEIMTLNPQFRMVYYADTKGGLVMLLRMSDGTFSKRFVRNTGAAVQIRYEHANPSYYGTYPNTEEPAETGYDPRKRPWYVLAETANAMAWTPVYLFATGHVPGFTCTVPVFDDRQKLRGVSSVDIAVDELSRFLGTLRPTPETKIVILDKQNNLVALQARREEDLNRLFVTSRDSYGNIVYDIAGMDALEDDSLRSILGELVRRPNVLTRITQEARNYQAILTPAAVGAGLELNIGIIIPEDDIIGRVRENLRIITYFSIALLVLILIVSSLLSWAIATPIRALSNEMIKIKSFDLDSEIHIHTPFQEIIIMRDSFEGMRGSLRDFRRYVPADLVAQLVRKEISADLGGEKREMTVFFSDIANFTSISERREPDLLVPDLCAYFEVVSKAILENRGTIDKYIGDSVMAFWGAPSRTELHAEMACRSALLIQDSLAALFRQWAGQGKPPFNTRMGIHTGEAIVGNMGYPERLNYTVIGDAVNVSSRLEGMNKIYGTRIIVSETTRGSCRALGDFFEFRLLDNVSVAGRRQALKIYELAALKGGMNSSLKKIYGYYETGLQYYFDKKWDEGLRYFNAVLKYRPADTPSRVLRERCLRFKREPPSEWNGVFVQTAKE